MTDETDDPDGLGARAVKLGRKGFCRWEIAEELGLSGDELEALEDEAPAFAEAMARAEDAAWAWWVALPRDAMGVGARFNMAAWREAMRWRFGETDRSPQAAPASRELARVELPDNGFGPGPDGKYRPYDPDEDDADDDADWDDADRDDEEEEV